MGVNAERIKGKTINVRQIINTCTFSAVHRKHTEDVDAGTEKYFVNVNS